MKDPFKFRFAGSGGMGVILGTIILAEAALSERFYVVQTQSYGPEARGGMCKAEMIISRKEIDFPKIEKASCLVALTQKSLDKYIDQLEPDGLIIADSTIEMPPNCPNKYVRVPIIDTTYDVIRKPITINIVALGAVNGILKLVSDSVLEKTVLGRVPKDTEELNKRALKEGKRLSETVIL